MTSLAYFIIAVLIYFFFSPIGFHYAAQANFESLTLLPLFLVMGCTPGLPGL